MYFMTQHVVSFCKKIPYVLEFIVEYSLLNMNGVLCLTYIPILHLHFTRLLCCGPLTLIRRGTLGQWLQSCCFPNSPLGLQETSSFLPQLQSGSRACSQTVVSFLSAVTGSSASHSLKPLDKDQASVSRGNISSSKNLVITFHSGCGTRMGLWFSTAQ